MNLINIEIKARCANPDAIRKALRARNARFAGTDHQVDTYFRVPPGSPLSAGVARDGVPEGRLKLRQGNIENALIAYRRPDQAGPKQSDVALAPVTAGDQLHSVLSQALGVLVAVDKQREIYYIDNVKFHVDEVAGLGSFVEIEACGPPDGDRDRLLDQCAEYMALFGIRDEDLVQVSYSDLLLAKAPSATGN